MFPLFPNNHRPPPKRGDEVMFRKAAGRKGKKWIVEGDDTRWPDFLLVLRSRSTGVRRRVPRERLCVVRTTEEAMAEQLMEAK